MSNASHAKEPSMEEILASIRRIIESGDERPSLPGLSLTPRARRDEAVAATATEPLPSAANGEGRPVAGEALPIPRGVPLALAEEPAPLRIFQPANAALADPDPFEDLATWEFSPVDAVALQPAPDLSSDRLSSDRVDAGSFEVVAAGPAADPAEAGEPGTQRMARPLGPHGAAIEPVDARSSSLAQSPDQAQAASPAPAPSLAQAYGVSRIDASRARPVFDERMAAEFVETTVPGDRIAAEGKAPLKAAADLAPSGEASAQGPSVQPQTIESDVPQAVATPSNALPKSDFSVEFDEDAFTEALRGAVTSGSFDDEAVAVAADAESSEAPSLAGLSTVMSETSSLMSAEAGSQVAAAFDDLARAIRDGQMKSMEEMAREMLRPMLQEWLDDNLPRLVERLVREEIERVARGGRR